MPLFFLFFLAFSKWSVSIGPFYLYYHNLLARAHRYIIEGMDIVDVCTYNMTIVIGLVNYHPSIVKFINVSTLKMSILSYS